MADNLFEGIPDTLADERFDEIVRGRAVTVERIVSRGHASPESGWYDQPRHEWVLVLKGRGRVVFESGEEVTLGPGEHLSIPAHCRHRVGWTDPNENTVWLAIHYE